MQFIQILILFLLGCCSYIVVDIIVIRKKQRKVEQNLHRKHMSNMECCKKDSQRNKRDSL